MSMYKQNIRPQKQCPFFRVNLFSNIDDGPYLKKDIMQSNTRSIALLSGKNILQNITHFNKSMVLMQNQNKQLSILIPQCVDNIIIRIAQFNSQIVQMQRQSVKLKKQQKKLKSQMQVIFERQKQHQKDLYQQCMPLLKKLFKTVRQNNSKQKQEYHQMQKALQEIQVTKKSIIQCIMTCQAKIMNLQQIIGYKTIGIVQDQFRLSMHI